MSVDLSGNCGICLDPLSNGKKIGYHKPYANESGQICDGSLHPTHWECAIDALKQSSIKCSSCKVPINLKSVELPLVDPEKVSPFIVGCVGGITGAAMALLFPSPLLSLTTDPHVDVLYRVILVAQGVYMGVRTGMGASKEIAADLLLNVPKFLEKMGFVLYDNIGANMIAVDGNSIEEKKPSLQGKVKNRQPPPGSGKRYLKPMQRK